MARINFYFQVFLSVVVFTQSALALKCYVCNSGTDSECSMSPPPERFLQECVHDDGTSMSKSQDLAGNSVPIPAPEEIRPGNEDPSFAIGHSLNKTESDSHMSRPSRSPEENADPMMKTDNAAGAPVAAEPQQQQHQPHQQPSADAPKEATFCRKISYHIPAQYNGQNSSMKASVRVLRSCGWIPEEKKGDNSSQSGCKWIGTDGTQMDQCVCTGDGCNSGNYIGSLTSQTMILLAVMTAGYFYVL